MNFTKNPVILQTDLPGIERHAQGKVRDVYSVDDNRLLIVATDRISAFDYILPTGIPDKGRVLTQLSIFWFDFLRDVTPTHFLTANVDEYPRSAAAVPRSAGRPLHAGEARQHDRDRMRRARLHLRVRLEGVSRDAARCAASSCPPACARATNCPSRSSRPPPRRRPGHDENVSFEHVVSLIGEDLAKRLRDLTLEIYSRAARYAETKGVIIADTKFEFGFVGDRTGAGR